MSKYPIVSLAFNIANSNKERIEAFELYQKTFNARKISESTPPDGSDIHIMMEINGFEILLAPGGEKNLKNVLTCQIQFDNENDLRKAYDILIQEGQNYSIGSYPWARVGALVTDKYGVEWWLCIY
jgi:uncharacterized glyoxalase superfamily protein PhnB